MASQGYGNISREEREAFLKKKMEDMKKKSEEILRRHAEVEADKRNADMLSDMVSTKIQTQTQVQTQSKKVIKDAKSASTVQKEKSSEKLTKIKNRNSQQNAEESIHPAEWKQRTHVSDENFTPRHKESEYRKKFTEDDGPPPDPVKYLADPYRDGSFPEVDRNQESRRHRSNYGGENFHNVKPVMQQRRNYERQHPPPPSSNSHLSMSVQMTGKERKEYENWKAERLKIDEERIARQKTSSGTWKREWDMDKTEQEEAAKKCDKQFYRQPRWISESGDYQDQSKRNQGSKGQFNPSFENKHHEKGDRSVVLDEHNTLTVIKSSDYADEQTFDSHHQRNQGGRKIEKSKQSSSAAEERNFSNRKDSGWKQNQEVMGALKGDGWEDNVEVGRARWDNESSVRIDKYPLQQTNSTGREWKAGTRYGHKRDDSGWQSRVLSNDTRRKSSSDMEFSDKQFVIRRQNSLDKAQHLSDGHQPERYNNNARKYEEVWKDEAGWKNSSRNNDRKKSSDGWEEIDGVNKIQNPRGRINSDGWEAEENQDKVRENSYGRASDGDDSFDSSFYEHKQRYFSSKKTRGGPFKGNSNSMFSSSEKGKRYLENRRNETSNYRAFASSEIKTNSPNLDSTDEFDYKGPLGRSKFWRGGKRGIDQGRTSRGNSSRGNGNTYRANYDRKDEFDYKGGTGRNEFWRGNGRGSNQGGISRGNGNACKTNRSSGQDYHNKNFTNSGTNDSSNMVAKDIKCKILASKDGWEFEPNNELQTSVKWDKDNTSIPCEDVQKSVAVAKNIELASSQGSEPEEGSKPTMPGDVDTESHDDSWEDITSGCESEVSDIGDGVMQKSNTTLLKETKFSNNKLQDDSKSFVTNDLGDKDAKSSDYCEGTSAAVSDISNVPFASSQNESIEKILEEVYNETIKNEHNVYTETEIQEQNAAVASDSYHIDLLSSAQDTSGFENENARSEDFSVSSSLDHSAAGLTGESVQCSNVFCEDTDSEKGSLAEETKNICDVSLLDYSLDEEMDRTSPIREISICETTPSSLDAEHSDKCDSIENNDLPVTSSPACENYRKIDISDDLCSKTEISLLAKFENAVCEESDQSVLLAGEPDASDSHIQMTEKETEETVEFSSSQNETNQSIKVKQMSELVIDQSNTDFQMPEMAEDHSTDSFSETIFLEAQAKHTAENVALNAESDSLPEHLDQMSDEVVKDPEQARSDMNDLTSVINDELLVNAEDNCADSVPAGNKNDSIKEHNTSVSCISSELIAAKDKNCTIEDVITETSDVMSNAELPIKENKVPGQTTQCDDSKWEATETQECDVISSSAGIANKCEDLCVKICSENTSEKENVVVDSTERGAFHSSFMQPLQLIGEVSDTDTSCDESKVDLDIAQETHISAPAPSNEVRNSISSPEVLADVSCANSVSSCEEASSSFNCRVDSCNNTSETVNKLEIKEIEHGSTESSVQLLSHSDIIVTDNNFTTAGGNSLYVRNEMVPVIDNEELSEGSFSVSQSAKTKEQVLENDILECDGSNENVMSDTKTFKDHFPRTVRKASTTESTTEFTEVLEVTTSIPQRTLVQHSDAGRTTCKDEYSVNKNDCEQISDCPS